MPGVHLSDTERKLQRAWAKSPNYRDALRAISISGEHGIRGLRDLSIEFKYPVTVICGKNGAGKSTLLALAMLAFSDPARREPRRGKGPRKSKRRKPTYQDFVFSDFFFKGPHDPDVTGLEIEWSFGGARSLSIVKRSNKWMHYERRLPKAVRYLGISRCVPSIEQRTLKSKFSGTKIAIPLMTQLSDDSLARLSRILGTEVSRAQVYGDDKYALRVLENRVAYSGFNMDTGEDAIVQILLALQDAPNKSILGIEEIELGIHPSALRALAAEIIAVSQEKDLQVVLTTHSEHFIDAVPRDARILLDRFGDNVYAVQSPTARMAATTLTGLPHTDLSIFVEDSAGEALLRDALESRLLRRIEIVGIGSKDEFRRVAQFIKRDEKRRRVLYLLDGDVSDAILHGLGQELGAHDPPEVINEPSGFTILRGSDGSAGRFPGASPPERWIVETLLADEAALTHLATDLNLSRGPEEAKQIMEHASTQRNHHNIFKQMSWGTGFTYDECRRHAIRALYKARPELKEMISGLVESLLEGA